MPCPDPDLDPPTGRYPDAGPDLHSLTGPPASPAERVGDLLADLGLSTRSVMGVVAVVAAGLVGWWWLRAPAPTAAESALPMSPAVTTPSSAAPTATTGPVTGGEVLAHAAGAVRRPGLYRLPVGARVDDLVRAAGGARPGADLDQVNLAAPLVDGTQVYVPRRGDTAGVGAPAPATVPGGTGPDVAGPVDVNRADLAALDTLPGVGPATAAAIIEHREANGPFTSVDQLIDVPGIGEAKLAALADLVTV